MRLREEIKKITGSQLTWDGDEYWPMEDESEIDEIINKILDAAVEAATERLIGVSEAQGAKRDKLSMIVAGNSMIDEINKLRGE